MSFSKIKSVVENFISNKDNDVLVLKGQWGVGKTYFWQSLIQEAGKVKSIGHDSYSYVSLFGINSLEELKSAILASSVNSAAIKPENISKERAAKAKDLGKLIDNIPGLREWTGGMVGTALFLFMKPALICFDDFERRGNGLDAKDILGLASLLKEQHGCKIVFIINEGVLSENDREDFKRHSEKIIDIELRFAPLPEEVFNYIFPSFRPYHDLIKMCCLTLGIKNIRILQRARRFVDTILPYLKDSEKSVIDDIIRSLILYVWCYYDKDSGAPPLSFVINYRSVDYLLARYDSLQAQKEKEESKEVQQWLNLLSSYGYTITDDVDKHVKNFVETGYFNNAAFSHDLDKKNKDARSQQGQHSHRMVWDLYHNSFDDNEQEFVSELVNNVRSNIPYLPLSTLEHTVRTLRAFEQDALANSLVDDYLTCHSGDPELITIKKSVYLDDIKDGYILERLNEIWESAKDERTLAEVVKKLTPNKGWNPEDTDLLASCSVSDYYDFFKSEKSEHLYAYVKTCLNFGEFGSADSQYKIIADRAKEALRKLASESRINRRRVLTIYGIQLDNNSSDATIMNKE